MTRRVLASLALAAASAGCTPSFDALTAPPPFTHAELCDATSDCGGSRTITLTKGIALAFECTRPQNATDPGSPCSGVVATMRDPTIATVLPGYLDSLAEAQPRSALVVVGKAVGRTSLSITTDQGDAAFDVDIVDF